MCPDIANVPCLDWAIRCPFLSYGVPAERLLKPNECPQIGLPDASLHSIPFSYPGSDPFSKPVGHEHQAQLPNFQPEPETLNHTLTSKMPI